MIIGRYVLDTLQVYFPWDDDLYTYLKEKGLMKLNPNLKVLPLIYSDNTLSTQGVPKIRRNYIVKPESFNETVESLGWEYQEKRYVIPAEQPQLEVELDDDNLKFSVIPTINTKEQYHLEYSVMSAFGKIYSNWVGFYFTLDSFRELLSRLQKETKFVYKPEGIPELNNESKMQQREQM